MEDGLIIYGNSTGHSYLVNGWDRTEIVSGTRIGLMLDFNQDDTATVTGYKDGVRVSVLSTDLRGPLCPAVWIGGKGVGVEFVSSRCPHS